MKVRFQFWLFLLLMILLMTGTALAHGIKLFAYVDSGQVYTESFFPDGRPVEGGKIRIFDGAGRLLVEGLTDRNGLLRLPIPKVDDLTIELDAAMGHKKRFSLKRADVEAGQ